MFGIPGRFAGNPAARTAAAFLPTSVSGLVGWWDMSDLSTINGGVSPGEGGGVSSVADKSGLANDLTQGTASLQPLLRLGVQNGLSAVSLDGADDWMALTNPIDFTATGHTVFAIVKRNTSGNFHFGQNGSVGTSAIAMWNSLGDYYSYDATYYHNYAAPFSTDVARYHLIGQAKAVDEAIGTAKGLFDGGAVTVATARTLKTGPSWIMNRIGRGNNVTTSGRVGELIAYNRVLSDSEMDAIRLYLNAKWAIYSTLNPADMAPTLWLDPSDLSTLWQDTAGTTPVTADGQAVARMDNKGSQGGYVQQGTAAARPLYKTDGVYHWLQFDGANDYLQHNASENISTTDLDAILGARFITTSTIGANLYNNDTIFSQQFQDYWGMGVANSTPGVSSYFWDTASRGLGNALAVGNDFVQTHRYSGGTQYMQLNSNTEQSGAVGALGKVQVAWTIGVSANASTWANCRFYGIILKNGGTFSSTHRSAARAWMAGKAGIIL